MIENIKRIGLFMIAAQTFMHFAAGAQYEKYIKIITGAIILLLFVQPFLAEDTSRVNRWQEEMDEIVQQIENQNRLWKEKGLETDGGAERYILRQLEQEIADRLRAEMSNDNYEISDVTISWKETEEEVPGIALVSISLQQTVQGQDAADLAGEERITPVTIENIQPVTWAGLERQDDGKEKTYESADAGAEEMQEEYRKTTSVESDKGMQEYRNMFARILGIEETKVEVRCNGGE